MGYSAQISSRDQRCMTELLWGNNILECSSRTEKLLQTFHQITRSLQSSATTISFTYSTAPPCAVAVTKCGNNSVERGLEWCWLVGQTVNVSLYCNTLSIHWHQYIETQLFPLELTFWLWTLPVCQTYCSKLIWRTINSCFLNTNSVFT